MSTPHWSRQWAASTVFAKQATRLAVPVPDDPLPNGLIANVKNDVGANRSSGPRGNVGGFFSRTCNEIAFELIAIMTQLRPNDVVAARAPKRVIAFVFDEVATEGEILERERGSAKRVPSEIVSALRVLWPLVGVYALLKRDLDCRSLSDRDEHVKKRTRRNARPFGMDLTNRQRRNAPFPDVRGGAIWARDHPLEVVRPRSITNAVVITGSHNFAFGEREARRESPD